MNIFLPNTQIWNIEIASLLSYVYLCSEKLFKTDLNSVIFCEILVSVLMCIFVCTHISLSGHYYETLNFEVVPCVCVCVCVLACLRAWVRA